MRSLVTDEYSNRIGNCLRLVLLSKFLVKGRVGIRSDSVVLQHCVENARATVEEIIDGMGSSGRIAYLTSMHMAWVCYPMAFLTKACSHRFSPLTSRLIDQLGNLAPLAFGVSSPERD
mgnify:FL=1